MCRGEKRDAVSTAVCQATRNEVTGEGLQGLCGVKKQVDQRTP